MQIEHVESLRTVTGVSENILRKKKQQLRYTENELEVCVYVCKRVCSQVGEGQKVREMRAIENKNSVREGDSGRETDRGRS